MSSPVLSNTEQRASVYKFEKHSGHTIEKIMSSPNGKFIFIKFTNGKTIRIRAGQEMTVQQFGN